MRHRRQDLLAERVWLQRLARSLANDPASADDLVQDTCVAALRGAPSSDPLRPWLRGVMRNLAQGRVRNDARRARRDELFRQSLPPVTATPEQALSANETHKYLADAVRELPEPFRSTIVSRYVECQSAADIARQQGVPAATVRWRHKRGLELLRTALAPVTEASVTAAPVTTAPVTTAPVTKAPVTKAPVGDAPVLQHKHRSRLLSVAWLPVVAAAQVVSAALGRVIARLLATKHALAMALTCIAVVLGLLTGSHIPDDANGADDANLHGPTAAAAGIGIAAMYNASAVTPSARAAVPDETPRLRAQPLGTALVQSRAATIRYEPDRGTTQRRRYAPARIGQRPRRLIASVLDDCFPGSELPHCPSISATSVGRPFCHWLVHNINLLETTRKPDHMTYQYANRFLLAAVVANLHLATNLGCLNDTEDSHSKRQGAGVSAGSDPAAVESECATEIADDGTPCTVCIDSDGQQSSACAPADCFPDPQADGSSCTTCIDASGESTTICEDTDTADPQTCFSEMQDEDLMCTTCVWADGQETTKCNPAQCTTSTDPTTGVECTFCTDDDGYSVIDCQGSGSGPPDPQICESTIEPGDILCTVCTYADGTQFTHCEVADCVIEYADNGLECKRCNDSTGYWAVECESPAPGECVSQVVDDGSTCITCTDEAGNTTITCGNETESP